MMAYLRHCLEELRRYRGDPHWHIAFESSDLLQHPETADAHRSTVAPAHERHHTESHESPGRYQESR
jgi:hypothetical protein